MRRIIPALVAVCLAVTGFAGIATGGVKRHYSHSYYAAAHRCGSKQAVGRNVRRDGLSTHRKVHRSDYIRLADKLNNICLSSPTVAALNTSTPASAPTQASAPTTSSGGVSGASATASSGLAQCIVQNESGGDPNAANGQYHGIGQWSDTQWQADGGGKYASSPTGATYAQQQEILLSEGDAGMRQQQGQYDGC